MNIRCIEFLKNHYSIVEPLTKKVNLSYYAASISGKESDYKKSASYQIELSKYYSSNKLYSTVNRIIDSDAVEDPLMKRELQLVHAEFLRNQFDKRLHEEIINLSTRLEQKFSTFRAVINENELTDNEIDNILETSSNSEKLKTTWQASKQIGKTVADDVIKLVKMRNIGATELGFKNYQEMIFLLGEQDPLELDILFDELDELTKDKYSELKSEVDDYLSQKLGVEINDLMPWHYEDKFFQTGPKIYNNDLDKFFQKQNIEELTKTYFNGMGLNIDDILLKSDLYEKKGKYQHAYCTNIDRGGDVRVVCNIKPNQKWMATMLHEFGHAVYDKFVSRNLPWELRTHSHIFTTEAIAMLFGRFAQNPDWLNKMGIISSEESNGLLESSFKSLQLEQLIFSRWVQVIYRFERAMYQNPDQDLNLLWWQLVEKYQLIKQPDGRDEPDWAAKIHLALYPAYYHNYILGELLASQLYSYINNKVLKYSNSKIESFVNNPDVGEYLKNLFFSYGALYSWNELITKATGEKLSVQYYTDQFVNKFNQ